MSVPFGSQEVKEPKSKEQEMAEQINFDEMNQMGVHFDDDEEVEKVAIKSNN